MQKGCCHRQGARAAGPWTARHGWMGTLTRPPAHTLPLVTANSTFRTSEAEKQCQPSPDGLAGSPAAHPVLLPTLRSQLSFWAEILLRAGPPPPFPLSPTRDGPGTVFLFTSPLETHASPSPAPPLQPLSTQEQPPPSPFLVSLPDPPRVPCLGQVSLRRNGCLQEG